MYRTPKHRRDPWWDHPAVAFALVSAILVILAAIVGYAAHIPDLPVLVAAVLVIIVVFPLRRAVLARRAERERLLQERILNYGYRAIESYKALLALDEKGPVIMSHSAVYQSPYELDDGLTMRILAELTSDHTGDIPRVR